MTELRIDPKARGKSVLDKADVNWEEVLRDVKPLGPDWGPGLNMTEAEWDAFDKAMKEIEAEDDGC